MVDGVIDKIISIFKRKTTKSYSKSATTKNVYGAGKKPRKLKITKII